MSDRSDQGAASDPDPDALRYDEHWRPVLLPAVTSLLDRVAAAPAATTSPATVERANGVPLVLDLGAGTGAISLAAARRWPQARIVGLDASAAMLSVARRRARELAGDHQADRFDWLVADAASVPLGAASADVVLSSFMLQLASDRLAVLREAARVLRPGGIFGLVTWIAEDSRMAADEEFDEAVYDLSIDDPESEPEQDGAGDYEAIETAHDELVVAGFGAVEVVRERLRYAWSADEYLRFKEQFDEHELFDSLSSADQARLRERVRERWAALPPSAFTLEAPLVSALAWTDTPASSPRSRDDPSGRDGLGADRR